MLSTPSKVSLPNSVSISGASTAPLLATIGKRPLPKPTSLIFSSVSLKSGKAVAKSSNKSGRVERTF